VVKENRPHGAAWQRSSAIAVPDTDSGRRIDTTLDQTRNRIAPRGPGHVAC
jgi:hypothetical protein